MAQRARQSVGFGSLVLAACAGALAGCRSATTPLQQGQGSDAATARRELRSADPRGGSTFNSDAVASRTGPDEAAGSSRKRRRGRALASTAPGQFDFYLFTLSWDPEYCSTHSSEPECTRHLGFVVHGMWPEDNNGNYPEACSTAAGPANPAQYTNVIPETGLVEHEWTEHGTCSGLAPDTFFGNIETSFAALKFPAGLGTGSQAAMAPSALIAQMHSLNPSYPASSFAISCGSNFLTAVEVCLDKGLKPEACPAVKTCGATTIKIAPID